jgi:hypothetical protein
MDKFEKDNLEKFDCGRKLVRMNSLFWGNKQFWDKTAMRWQADGLLSCSDGCKTSLLN